jgi:hypothetical protein
MKLDAVLKVAAPFLATDKKPEELRRAILAADKRGGKDAAGSGLGSRELEEKDKPGAQDKAMDEREAACDEREEAMDSKEDAMDKAMDEAEKEKQEAKDRKGARDKRAKDRMDRKMGRDARAKDRNDDPEHTNDEDYTEGADPSTPGGNRAGGKTAVDSAEVDRRVLAAITARDALHEARTDVEPILGKVALDSAEAVYRSALDKLGVDHKGVHPSALRTMVALAKDRANKANEPTGVAMDSAGIKGLEAAIPGYGRLK